mmetsp:Transcript_113214/g.283452  ORF Transcript_113214/g.283452 Transcript_113214/m.283452 type:complete len:416 (+) Transcript_113214:86-1333(+)
MGCFPLPWDCPLPRRFANGRFKRGHLIGEGTFGKVYSAINTKTKQEVAVKVEDISSDSSQLQHEAEVLQLLRGTAQPQGFAEHFYSGQECLCMVLVMELLGSNLEHMLDVCSGTFQVKSTVLIAEQLLQRFEYLHSKGVVHRDVKPENFVLGVKEKQHHLHVIDFGLSNRWYYNGRHTELRRYEGMIGTVRYASLSAHRFLEQSRRDDLEALGHMLLYFLRGSLPWSGLPANLEQRQKLKKIRLKKESVSYAVLCKGFPKEFERYVSYCRGLGFRERPDYAMLRGLFRSLRSALTEQEGQAINDHDFEWNSGKDLGKLEPLDLVASYPQPDDTCSSQRRLLGAPGHARMSSCHLTQADEGETGAGASAEASQTAERRLRPCRGEAAAECKQAKEAEEQDEAQRLLRSSQLVACGA